MIDFNNKIFFNPAWILVAFLLALGGCASSPPAAVEDRSLGGSRDRPGSGASPVRLPQGSYRVRRGDTLYSIAFRNGLDYRDLARLNRIGPPYTIYVDQVIRLDSRTRSRRDSTVAARPPRSGSSRALPSSRPQAPPLEPGVDSKVQTTPEVSSSPAPANARTPGPRPAVPSTPSPGMSDSVSSAGIAWRWPAEGKRDGGFVPGDQTRQGININGNAGDPVRAAADGVVVYSGNGLIGYGELIIIKHNASMLSAYGHNRRRLVQEGDRIKAGQQIAEMGSSSASRDMLHFEIRKNGKPVDPLAFLPAR